jgi:methionine-gamma-lyase
MMYHLADNSLAVTLAVSLGQIRTLIEHPASDDHAAIPVTDQLRGGIDPGGIRLSIGLEASDDILADLEKALKVAVLSDNRWAAAVTKECAIVSRL